MKTGTEGITLMHHYEGCYLFSYPDPASPLGRSMLEGGFWLRFLNGKIGMDALPPKMRELSGKPWTIARGHTGPDVKPGITVTQEQADALFAARLAREFEPGVLAALKRTPTQPQFDALVCFAYNVGLGNLRASTLLKKFNAGDIAATALQFLVWNRAAGRRMLGLTRRRHAESWVFQGIPAVDAIARAQKIEVA